MAVIGAAAAAFWVAWIVNVDYVRRLVQQDFGFGEAEMLRVLESVNRADTLRFSYAGIDYELDLELRQVPGADLSRQVTKLESAFRVRASACVNRTFRQTASACRDTTSVPVEGMVALRRRSDAQWQTLLARGIAGSVNAIGRNLGQVTVALRADRDYVELRSKDAQTFTVNIVKLTLDPNEAPLDFSGH